MVFENLYRGLFSLLVCIIAFVAGAGISLAILVTPYLDWESHLEYLDWKINGTDRRKHERVTL